MSKWSDDAEDIRQRIDEGFIVAEYGPAESMLEYLAHESRADTTEINA